MKSAYLKTGAALLACMALLLAVPGSASAVGRDIPGEAGTTFNLVTGKGLVTTGDGNSIAMWGFGLSGGAIQYPGPTLIVTEGQAIEIHLTNSLSVPVSIVLPGQTGVTATGGVAGLFTMEAPPGGTVTYSFTPAEPGTYLYQSGTNPDLQVEMGLLGALIVRPAAYDADTNRIAYNDPGGPPNISEYEHEYLMFMTDMDLRVHDLVDQGRMDEVDTSDFKDVYWFLNGRTLPDTLAADGVAWLPNQPYGALLRIHPGERALYRMVGGGRDGHPMHTHGNNHTIIAKDGRILRGPANENLSQSAFTTGVFPGETTDVLFTWTGTEMGWDIFGHSINDAMSNTDKSVEVYGATNTTAAFGAGAAPVTLSLADTTVFPQTRPFRAVVWIGGTGIHDALTREVVKIQYNGADFDIIARGLEGTTASAFSAGAAVIQTDHGKAVPVVLPSDFDLTFGQFYSGSPFLGAMGSLPPGEGGFNVNGGLFFMHHSHNEKELTNADIFPGGMATFVIIEPFGVSIP